MEVIQILKNGMEFRDAQRISKQIYIKKIF